MRPENTKHIHFVIIIDPVSYLCSCMSNISCGVICRHYFRVMTVSALAGFQIQQIPSRWYIDDQKDKGAAEKVFFVNQEAAQNFLGMIPNPSTTPATVTAVLRCAAKKGSSMGKCGDSRDKQLNLLLNMTAMNSVPQMIWSNRIDSDLIQV
jgi:hypothetical protein